MADFNPFESALLTTSNDTLQNMATDLNLRRKMYGGNRLFERLVPPEQYNAPSIAERVRSTVRSDPSEIVTAPLDLAMMGTGDLYNKAASGYAGLGAAAGEYSASGDFGRAIDAGAEAIRGYKAPEGPARNIQERPRSKALEQVFEPLNRAIQAGSQSLSDNALAQMYYNIGTEAGMDFLMGKHGAKAVGKMKPGLSTDVFYSAAERALDKVPGDKIKGQSLPNALLKLGATKAELTDLGVYEIAKSRASESIPKTELKELFQQRGFKLGEEVLGRPAEMETNLKAVRVFPEYAQPGDDPYFRIIDRNNGDIVSEVNADSPAMALETYREMAEMYGEEFNETPYFAQEKPVQFAGYKAIPGEGDPGTYREGFVTADVPPVSDHVGRLSNEIKQLERDQQQLVDQLAIQESRITEQQHRTNEELMQSIRDKKSELEKLGGKPSWRDPHSLYSDIENPVVRYRYDIRTQPDGKRLMFVHEYQPAFKKPTVNYTVIEPRGMVFELGNNLAKANEKMAKYPGAKLTKEISSPVPEALRDRAYDLAVKKSIAEAQAMGLDGVAWSTGAQQVDLYSNALRNVADEARWNPETQELQLYKDGRRVMKDQIPDKVSENKLEEIIGKAAARRLVESEATGERYRIEKTNNGKSYQIIDNVDNERIGITYPTLAEAKARAASFSGLVAQTKGFKVTRDLSIDKQWPARTYGDFENITKEPVKLDWKPATEDLGFEPYEVEAGSETVVVNGNAYNVVPSYHPRLEWEIIGQDRGEVKKYGFKSKEAAKKYVEEQELAKVSTSGAFNTKARIPSLFEKYGKGKVGVLGENIDVPKLEKLDEISFKQAQSDFSEKFPGVELPLKRHLLEIADSNGFEDNVGVSTGRYLNKTGLNISDIYKWLGEKYGATKTGQQPVFWFDKGKTPTEFPLYEGTTGVFRMLQDQIKKEGGGAKGVAQVAMKYGVPATLLAAYLRADDEGRKKLLAMPAMAGLIKYIQYTKTGNPIETAVKATPGELRGMLKDANKEHAGSGLRYVKTDKTGDVYAARAMDVTHSQLADKAVEWGDNESLEGGKLFTDKDIRDLFAKAGTTDTGHAFELKLLKKYRTENIFEAWDKMTKEEQQLLRSYVQKNKKGE